MSLANYNIFLTKSKMRDKLKNMFV